MKKIFKFSLILLSTLIMVIVSMGNTKLQKNISIDEMKSYLIEAGVSSLYIEVTPDEQIKNLYNEVYGEYFECVTTTTTLSFYNLTL